MVGATFTAAVTHEDQLFVARCLEIEVTSHGDTVGEALENLKEALELHFKDVPLPEDGEPLLIAKIEISS